MMPVLDININHIHVPNNHTNCPGVKLGNSLYYGYRSKGINSGTLSGTPTPKLNWFHRESIPGTPYPAPTAKTVRPLL